MDGETAAGGQQDEAASLDIADVSTEIASVRTFDRSKERQNRHVFEAGNVETVDKEDANVDADNMAVGAVGGAAAVGFPDCDSGRT